MTEIADALARLESRWRTQGAPILGHLRSGLSDVEMDALTGPLGIELPAEARALWAWHDGVSNEVGREFRLIDGNHEFLPLSEAVALYEQLLQNPGSPDVAASWFPLFSTLSRPIVVCETAPPQGQTFPVYVVSPGDFEEPEFGASSLAAAIDIWLEGFEAGVFFYDPELGRWSYNNGAIPDALRLNRLVD